MLRYSIRWLIISGALLCTTLHAQPPCSLHTVVGTWAASSTGTFYVTSPGTPDPTPVPGAALGLVSIGWDGSFWSLMTGWGSQGKVGTWKGPALGTITVNPDCTGSFSATHPAGWKMTEQIKILDRDEIWTFPPQGMQGLPAVWQCRWRRIAGVPLSMLPGGNNCSADLLRGTWVGSYSGVIVKSSPVSAGISFFGIIDYQGRLSGEYISSVGGQVGSGEYAGGIAEVKPDCSGTWNWTLNATGGSGLTGSGTEKFVILDNGNELWTLSLQGPAGAPIGLSKYRRISPVPAY